MKYSCLFLLLFFCSSAFAFDRFSFATATANNEQHISSDISRFWNIGDSRFFLGTGIRGAAYWGSNQEYKTAPALLTTGQEGPQVIFLSDKKDNIDILRPQSSQVSSINLVVHLLFQLNKNWEFGTNIDVIGGSFGKKQKAKYNPVRDDQLYSNTVEASPTPFNALLISENDRGSLNSEFYALKKIGSGWGIKFIANYSFTEYTTTSKLRNKNDRFRRKTLLPSIGLTRDF